jgi:ligand-binding sensor domain-containing protein
MRRLVWVMFLLAPALPGQQYPFIPVANSPRNIEHILQDKQGRLWIATHDDVLCFDGSRFFSLHEFGLPKVQSALSEDLDGGILSASAGGVYRFFQGRLERVLSGVIVQEAVGVAPGVLLAAAAENRTTARAMLYRMRTTNGAWQAEQLGEWQSGNSLSRDHAGNILTACPGGWCEIPASQIVNWNPQHPIQPIFHQSGVDIQRVARDRAGCLWFRSVEAGAYQCPADQQPVLLPAAIAGRNVWAAEEESEDGSMLFANVASLASGRPGSFQVVTPANGLPAVAVTCAVRARDGSIWAGSISGLYRFPFPFRMQYWRSRHGLVWSFARSGARMLAGTSAGVAYLSEAGEWNILKGSREFGSISSLLPDKQGNIYAAVSREAVIQLSPDIYGVGFGPVTGGLTAGTLVTQLNSLTTPIQFLFGSTLATVSYYGLAPSFTGLYQFDVTVPSVSASNAEPISITLGETKGSQTLYIAVQN